MKVTNKIRGYSKLDQSTKRAINQGIDRLKSRIETYLTYNDSFDSIVMDDKLIHDAYVSNGKRFFLFKCRIKTISLRLLYTFEKDNVVVIAYICKKNSRYEYFDYFENECDEYMHRYHRRDKQTQTVGG